MANSRSSRPPVTWYKLTNLQYDRPAHLARMASVSRARNAGGALPSREKPILYLSYVCHAGGNFVVAGELAESAFRVATVPVSVRETCFLSLESGSGQACFDRY